MTATFSMRQDNAGPATARNRGWFSAHGRVIAFTDDDTLPDARWLGRSRGRLRRRSVTRRRGGTSSSVSAV